MALQIPTTAPLKIRQLARLEWKRTYSDFPSDGWDVAAYLDGVEKRHEIAGVPSASPSTTYTFTDEGDDFAIGVYGWQVWAVSTGTEGRRFLEEGVLEVLASSLEGHGLANASTHASRMLALIEARLEGRLPLDAENYSIGSRSLARIPILELKRLRTQYRIEAAGELRARQAGITPGKRRRYRIAFGS
jgi:hypothetical protein